MLKVFTNDGWLIFEEAYLRSVLTFREVRGNFDTKYQSRREFVTVFYAFAGFFWRKRQVAFYFLYCLIFFTVASFATTRRLDVCPLFQGSPGRKPGEWLVLLAECSGILAGYK
jgi:hypothetical protein